MINIVPQVYSISSCIAQLDRIQNEIHATIDTFIIDFMREPLANSVMEGLSSGCPCPKSRFFHDRLNGLEVFRDGAAQIFFQSRVETLRAKSRFTDINSVYSLMSVQLSNIVKHYISAIGQIRNDFLDNRHYIENLDHEGYIELRYRIRLNVRCISILREAFKKITLKFIKVALEGAIQEFESEPTLEQSDKTAFTLYLLHEFILKSNAYILR